MVEFVAVAVATVVVPELVTDVVAILAVAVALEVAAAVVEDAAAESPAGLPAATEGTEAGTPGEAGEPPATDGTAAGVPAATVVSRICSHVWVMLLCASVSRLSKPSSSCPTDGSSWTVRKTLMRVRALGEIVWLACKSSTFSSKYLQGPQTLWLQTSCPSSTACWASVSWAQ